MNVLQLKFGHLLPEIKEKFVNEDIEICCECGGLETTILTRGIYCRVCRSFRSFKERKFEQISTQYEQFDDDD